MARHKDTLTLSVPFGTKEQLDDLARQHQLMWGESPSPSRLITAIATGEIALDARQGYSTAQIGAFKDAIDALLHRGKHVQARTLTKTLLASQALPDADRVILMEKLQALSSPWLDTIERLRQERRAFSHYI